MGIAAYGNSVTSTNQPVRIENISVGDILREALTGKNARVLNVWQGPAVGMFHIACANGGNVDLTEDHRLLTNRGPVWAGEIEPGASLRCPDGWTECVEAFSLPGDFMVYDVKLEKIAGEDAWLIVNGLAVGG